MISMISALLIALASLLAIPALTLLFEIAGALRELSLKRLPQTQGRNRPSVAVLIPAHNEGMGLRATVADVRAQLKRSDRLVVVADNCNDNTALIASKAGAEVIERHDPLNIGKGHALDFGLKHLSNNPPQVLIIVDADCRVAEGTIDQLALTCAETGRPAQALDLMTAPPHSSVNFRVAEFAWRVKNWARPLGLAAFGLPCQLMGTGMAIPWALLYSLTLASGSLVEDLALGLTLADAGSAPVFCVSGKVTSQFPSSAEGAQSQRYRWEQGHIHLIATAFPKYLFRAIARKNLSLLALTIDLAVPPVSLFFILLAAMLIATSLVTLAGVSSTAFLITALAFTALVSALVLAWWNFGRDVLPIQFSGLVASYIASKIPMYCRTLSGNITAHWKRTDRKSPR
jgi:cellulose synthase/poly-beta-1,6-N-acetylglucosamine synthase-like glycosyltransferase